MTQCDRVKRLSYNTNKMMTCHPPKNIGQMESQSKEKNINSTNR